MNARTLILALAIVLSLAPLLRADDDAAKLRTISTSGTATVYVTPDQAVIRFQVKNFDPDLKKARAMNDAACASMIKVVKECGVVDRDIQTDRAFTDPVYFPNNIVVTSPENYRPNEARKLAGYETGRTYVVTLRNLDNFQPLVDTILTTADCSLQSFEFQTSELRKFRDEARKTAVHAAKEKAVALAIELDSKVGKPRTISEYSDEPSFSNRVIVQSVRMAPGGDDADETTPLGQIPVRATVNVTFDLE